jgi:uncharacterized protein YdeI (YjbR/CyaY-like superfamily)
MNGTNPKVDEYISKITKWQAETEKLRRIILDCGLDEELKWGKPCYSFGKNNIAIIQGFKEYFALLFFKGSLLRDPHCILKKTGENAEIGRQIRFANVDEISGMEHPVKACIYEAIEVEKAGLKVTRTNRDKLTVPEEIQQKMDEIPVLKTAFEALTPDGNGRTCSILHNRNNPKYGSRELKRVFLKFLTEKG